MPKECGVEPGGTAASRQRCDGSSWQHLAMNTGTVIDWLGYAAATLTTASFLPQAWLTVRSRDVSGISLGMYATFTVGVTLWLAYGLLLGAWPLIAANSVTLLLAAVILTMKLRLGGAPPSDPG